MTFGRRVSLTGLLLELQPIRNPGEFEYRRYLMLNGMDAMRNKGAGSPLLTVMTFVDTDNTVRIAVRDAGHGIAPEHVHRIFESFYTTKADGMGLGLSIARSLVAAQGGRLWAENNADGGATFTFTLPSTH